MKLTMLHSPLPDFKQIAQDKKKKRIRLKRKKLHEQSSQFKEDKP